ncbi:MAG: tetratricopeptide repeat protein [Planctomycetota bacterium]
MSETNHAMEDLRSLEERVAVQPADIATRERLAMALAAEGRVGEAIDHLRHAVRLAPDAVSLINNLGALHGRAGQHEAAIDCYRRVTSLAPTVAVPHANLGEALLGLGRLDEALSSLRVAATLDPDLAEAWALLGRCALAQRSAETAIGPLRRVVALAPDRADAWASLGDALQSLRRPREAIECWQRAAGLGVDDADLWYGLGHARVAVGEAASAASDFVRCLSRDQAHVAAKHELGKALFQLGCVERGVGLLREAAAQAGDEHRRLALQNLAVVIPGDPQADGAGVRAAREAWVRSLAMTTRPRRARREHHGPLRVGYVSSFFHRANWMKPVWPLIRNHDRDRVQVHLFVDGPVEGITAQSDDRVCVIRGLGNAEAAERIAAQELDLLVDLNSYSAPERLPLFLHRPAPVQIAWFNCYATTGMDCFDALIGDEHVVRPEEESQYGERILRVPGSCLTFAVDHPTPEVVAAPHRRAGHFTFGSLASLYKLTDATLRAWSVLLARRPHARLLLRNAGLGSVANREFLAARFAAHGIANERLILEGPGPHLDFLATYDRIDLALDPFPYSGGTTTMESLWQGVPVVTFDGDRWASRTSLSLLRAADLHRFVAADVDGYVDLCASLAEDPTELDALRPTLRERLSASSACDVSGFARAMEALYLRLTV